MGLTAQSTDQVAPPQLVARHILIPTATELDCSSGPELVAHFVDLVDCARSLPMTIDLANVAFIDAAGVRALFECRAIADHLGLSLRFQHPSPAVRRLAALFDELAELIDEER